MILFATAAGGLGWNMVATAQDLKDKGAVLEQKTVKLEENLSEFISAVSRSNELLRQSIEGNNARLDVLDRKFDQALSRGWLGCPIGWKCERLPVEDPGAQ